MTDIHPMIEKLVRAAVAVEMADRGLGYDDLSDLQRDRAIASVIAVLRTLKEPDETMVEAGNGARHSGEKIGHNTFNTFTAMIDFILPEEKEQP